MLFLTLKTPLYTLFFSFNFNTRAYRYVVSGVLYVHQDICTGAGGGHGDVRHELVIHALPPVVCFHGRHIMTAVEGPFVMDHAYKVHVFLVMYDGWYAYHVI